MIPCDGGVDAGLYVSAVGPGDHFTDVLKSS